MANPFARRQQAAPAGTPINNLQFNIQNESDPVDYAGEMLKRSGGDARAAFYLACQEKGIDPAPILQQAQMAKNPMAMVQSMLMNNPKGKNLLSLLSLVK